MGFTTKEGMVRIDRFKPSGKWYETLEIDMSPFYNHPSTHEAVKLALIASGFVEGVHEWTWVCLEPYHQWAHPVMMKAV